MKEKSLSKLSTILIIGAAFCWGSVGLISRPLLAYGIDPIQMTLLRCGTTAVFLVLYTLIKDRKAFIVTGARDILLILWTGIFGFSVLYVCYFATVEKATLSLAAVLLYTAPYFVMIMSAIIFKEKITKVKITALVIATMGCILSTGLISTLTGAGDSHISIIGILTGIMSGFFYASYTITSNALLKRYSSLTIITYGFGLGSIALIPICDFGGMIEIVTTNGMWIHVLVMALCCTLLPYALYMQGLKHTEPSKASIMALMEPVVATIWGVCIFKELLTFMGFIGIVLIFVSVVILNIKIGEKKL